VTIAQLSLFFLFQDVLTEKIVRLAVRLDQRRKPKSVAQARSNPAMQSSSETSAPRTPERMASRPNSPKIALVSDARELVKPAKSDIGEPLQYATTALESDAYSHQARKELIERFGLRYEEADEIVRIAQNRILRRLEARNPEAWKALGLTSRNLPSAGSGLDDPSERRRMAGMDALKEPDTFNNAGVEEIGRHEAEFAKIVGLKTHISEADDRLHSAETTHEPMGKWTVYVDDNYHYMDDDERYVLGSFNSYDEALATCQKVIDEFLEANDAKSAQELFESYLSFGEDPWIKGPHPFPERPPFSAREYARQRCFELRA
jgi:hypothetical protein